MTHIRYKRIGIIGAIMVVRSMAKKRFATHEFASLFFCISLEFTKTDQFHKFRR